MNDICYGNAGKLLQLTNYFQIKIFKGRYDLIRQETIQF